MEAYITTMNRKDSTVSQPYSPLLGLSGVALWLHVSMMCVPRGAGAQAALAGL